MMSLGKNLQRIRKQKGLSQEQLAAKLNITRQALSKWESDINVPSVDKIIDVAKVLEVSVNELLGIEDSADDKYAQLESILNQVVLTQNNEIKRTKRYLKIGVFAGGGSILIICLIWWSVFNNINGVKSSMRANNDELNNQITIINNRLSSLDAVIANEVQQQLNSQEALLNSFDFKINTLDFENKMMNITFDVVAKKYDDNSQVELEIEFESQEIYRGTSSLKDGHYILECNLPVDNILNVTVTLNNGVKQTQVLKDVATDLLEHLRISYAGAYSFDYRKDEVKCTLIFDDIEEDKYTEVKKTSELTKVEVTYNIIGKEYPTKVKIEGRKVSFKIPYKNMKDKYKLYLNIDYSDKLGLQGSESLKFIIEDQYKTFKLTELEY